MLKVTLRRTARTRGSDAASSHAVTLQSCRHLTAPAQSLTGDEKLSAQIFFFPLPFPPLKYWWTCYYSPSALHLYTIITVHSIHYRVPCFQAPSHYLLLLGLSDLNSGPHATWREFSNRLWRTWLGLNWNVFVQNMVDRLFTSSTSDKSTTLVSYWLHNSGFPKNIKCYLQTKRAAKAH